MAAGVPALPEPALDPAALLDEPALDPAALALTFPAAPALTTWLLPAAPALDPELPAPPLLAATCPALVALERGGVMSSLVPGVLPHAAAPRTHNTTLRLKYIA